MKIIYRISIMLIAFSLSVFSQPSQDTLLRMIKSSIKQQQQNYIKTLHKDIYRYEIVPIAFTPQDSTLPDLTKGHILYFDYYGGIIWTNSKKNDSLKVGDSAYAVIKTWLITKSDTTFKTLWFKINSRRQWYRIK